jgi:hypothetical protein
MRERQKETKKKGKKGKKRTIEPNPKSTNIPLLKSWQQHKTQFEVDQISIGKRITKTHSIRSGYYESHTDKSHSPCGKIQ